VTPVSARVQNVSNDFFSPSTSTMPRRLDPATEKGVAQTSVFHNPLREKIFAGGAAEKTLSGGPPCSVRPRE